VQVQLASRLRGIPSRAALTRWARAALGLRFAHLTLRVVNTAEARALNRAYRGRDYPPNVLTFAYSGTPPAADIVVCAPVAAREAREQGKPRGAHYAHLTVHGVLHALGFDHATPSEARAMEAREIAILGTLGFADPYRIDRVMPATSPRPQRPIGSAGRRVARPAR
jgi:probable rRNA maturation factor